MREAVGLRLDAIDLILLRWLADFSNTGKMQAFVMEGKPFYWVKYSKIIQDFPILGIQKDTVYRRFKAMSDKGVLIKRRDPARDDGEPSCGYAFGPKYAGLIEDYEGEEYAGIPENEKQVELQKPSNATPSIETKTQKAREVIEYFNAVTGMRLRTISGSAHMSLIVSRLNSGFSVQDCKNVIRYKHDQWRGTEMEQYIRPSTLFRASRFEEYLSALPPEYQGDPNAVFEDAIRAEGAGESAGLESKATSGPSIWEQMQRVLASGKDLEDDDIEKMIMESCWGISDEQESG
jgi:uncharacterized phage protein (TIGR02220 family)